MHLPKSQIKMRLVIKVILQIKVVLVKDQIVLKNTVNVTKKVKIVVLIVNVQDAKMLDFIRII